MRIICCRFGNKFTNWHVKNLKHMIDKYSGLSYDSFEVIENDLYGNWYNKLQMYDKFRDGENHLRYERPHAEGKVSGSTPEKTANCSRCLRWTKGPAC